MKMALKHSLPAICCYLPLGIVYGLIFTQHGFPWYYAPLYSAFIYAGAMQFLALMILAAGGSLLTLSLALIPLAMRNIFYGMSFLERFKNCHPLLRIYLAHGLVDATYSILLTNPQYEDEKKDIRYITTLTVLIHASWIVGTFLGTFIDSICTLPAGLEFSLTAFFAASAIEQIRKKKELKPILIALASIAIALLIAPSHLFLAGMGIAAVAIMAIPSKERSVA